MPYCDGSALGIRLSLASLKSTENKEGYWESLLGTPGKKINIAGKCKQTHNSAKLGFFGDGFRQERIIKTCA